jgi:hypothetical protein
VPLYKKKAKTPVIKNYRYVSLILYFPKVFEIGVHDYLFYYFKNNLTPSEHVFFQSKSTFTKLVSNIDYNMTPVSLCATQRQVNAICSDFSIAFGCVCHSLLLQIQA